jgi:putative hydrolase of the HAD superfamily
MMIKGVIFDMFETLVTHYKCPLYFGSEIADDLGINTRDFLKIWDEYEEERTIGKVDLEFVLSDILTRYNKYSLDAIRFVVKKRVKIKQQCFENISEEIVAMLDILKKKKIKIGLISNCFSEEVEVIKDSILYNYFDVCCLSYEMGIKKPDQRIFRECVKMLDVKENECIYIGDGGSNELDAAKSVGIRAVQATWFISEQSKQYKIKPDVEHLNRPINIEKLISALDVKNRQN